MRADVNANFSMISDNTYTISQEWKVFNVLGDGVAAPAAKMEIDQNSGTGGIPVLELDQGDGDQAFINCAGTSASDSSASISDATTTGSSKVGAIRIQVNGSTKWIRIYDTAV